MAARVRMGGKKALKAFCHPNDCIIREIKEEDYQGTLEVYQQVEDFLPIGPVPKALMEMVCAGTKLSKES